MRAAPGREHWFAKKLTCGTTKAEYQCVPIFCRFPDNSVERGANIRIEREEMCIGALPQMLIEGFDHPIQIGRMGATLAPIFMPSLTYSRVPVYLVFLVDDLALAPKEARMRPSM